MTAEKPTKAQMMKRLYDERKSSGLIRRYFWLTDDQYAKVKKYVSRLQGVKNETEKRD